MLHFIDLRWSVCVSAATGQQHALVVEADVVYERELIVGDCLLKCPEEVIRGSHQQGAVLYRVLLIPPEGRNRIFLSDAVETLYERFDS